MTRSLFTVTKDLSHLVQRTLDTTCTDTGGTGSWYDAKLSSYPVDHFNGGTIWFTTGTNNGSSVVITDFNNTYGYGTFSPAVAAATASGDGYTIAGPKTPRDKLRTAINNAIKTLIEVKAENTALVTAANTEDYTLPAGVANVLSVELAGQTTAPYYYTDFSRWREISGKLRIDNGFFPDAGLTIRLTYLTNPASMTADTDTIPAELDRNGYYMLLLWQAAYYVFREQMQRIEGGDQLLENQLNEAAAQIENYKRSYPLQRYDRQSRKGGW